jgi:integrase
MTRPKAPKGSVTVRSTDERLYLRWSWSIELGGNGKRYEIATGLNDTKANRAIADFQAKSIERDLVNRLFDPTLRKYRGDRAGARLTVGALFEKFIKAKTAHVYKTTLIKYRGLLTNLQDFFKTKSASDVGEPEAVGFRDWLVDVKKLAPVTIRDKLYLAAAAWDWAIEDARLPSDHRNPWNKLTASHKVPPQQKPKPLSIEEVRAIIAGFRTDPDYSFYVDFVEFFLGVGCRTGEAVALRWQHLSDDCSSVWIGQSVTVDGDRKTTKTNKARSFPLTPRLQKLLLARRPTEVSPEAAVFPSRKGKTISTRNFAKRGWRAVLERLNIDYRRPYISRHTNATISIFEYNENPASVAQRLGHDPRTLFRNYLGEGGQPNAPPDFLGDD